MSRVLFDTNVLIAAMIVNHADHMVCRPWLESVIGGQNEGFFSLHSLAETFAIFTRAPLVAGKPLDVDDAYALIQFNLSLLHGVALEESDYWLVIDRMRRLKLPGGAIYDAIHAQAALKSGADVLLTLNEKHFIRLGADLASLVQNPRTNTAFN
jgi:predicted nucleic acid-binding protein